MVKVAIGMAKMVYISSLYVNVRVHISNWCNASVMFKSARLHIFKLYNTNVRSYDTLLLTYVLHFFLYGVVDWLKSTPALSVQLSNPMRTSLS